MERSTSHDPRTNGVRPGLTAGADACGGLVVFRPIRAGVVAGEVAVKRAVVTDLRVCPPCDALVCGQLLRASQSDLNNLVSERPFGLRPAGTCATGSHWLTHGR